MKILKSFNTKLDVEELLEATEKYGEGNVILIKRHRIKLILPLISIFIALFVVAVMIYVIYLQIYDENKILFWITAILYIYTTLSWSIHTILGIMANIVRQTRSEKKYIDTTDIVEEKQIGFEKFLKHTFVTFSIHTVLLLLNMTVPFLIIKHTGLGNIASAIAILIINIIFLLILNRVMYRIIDYEMNFNICTSDLFTSYSQKGFFKVKSMDISTSAIRGIQSSKEGLCGALLQYGNLCIHTDGDFNVKGGKTLELSFIPDPKRLAKKLNLMIEKGKEMMIGSKN